jgi:hypothetical protein
VEVAREAIRTALLVAAWLHRHDAPAEIDVWDARFEGEDLVVELNDHRCYTVQLTERPDGGDLRGHALITFGLLLAACLTGFAWIS